MGVGDAVDRSRGNVWLTVVLVGLVFTPVVVGIALGYIELRPEIAISMLVGVAILLVRAMLYVPKYLRKRSAPAAIRPGEPLDDPSGGSAMSRSVNEPAVEPVASLPPDEGEACCLEFGPDGMLVIGRRNGKVELWRDVESGSPVVMASMTDPGSLVALALSVDGRRLATVGEAGTVVVRNLRSDQLNDPATVVYPDPGKRRAILAAAFHPKLALLATADEYRAVTLWDIGPGHDPVAVARMPISRLGPTSLWRHRPVAVRFSPDGRSLAGGAYEVGIRPVWLWDTADPANPRLRAKLKPYKIRRGGDFVPVCHALAFHPRQALLVTATECDTMTGAAAGVGSLRQDSAVTLWDLGDQAEPTAVAALGQRGGNVVRGYSGKPKRVASHTVGGHGGTVRCLAITGDGRRLATGGDDSVVLLWDITDPARPRCLRTIPHDEPLRAVSYSPNQRFLATCTSTGHVTVWAV